MTSSAGPQPSDSSPRQKPARRISPRHVVAAVLLVLVVIFVLENRKKVKVRLIVPEVDQPLWITLLIAAVLGALIAALLRRRRQHKNE